MAALDFPNSPSNGDIFLAQNGINYQWDGEKWVVYIASGAATNYWQRDSVELELKPINSGDSLAIVTTGNVDSVTLDAASGDVTATGVVSASGYDIEALPDLP